MNVKKLVFGQVIFLFAILSVLYLLYPKIDIELNGNVINFESINANVIVLSENPDFSNPRYLEIKDNLSLALNPGKYYWKASNKFIEGMGKEVTIDSEVGMKLEVTDEEEANLENVGNVKINITKTKSGKMVGHIILETDEEREVENDVKVKYIGEQDE